MSRSISLRVISRAGTSSLVTVATISLTRSSASMLAMTYRCLAGIPARSDSRTALRPVTSSSLVRLPPSRWEVRRAVLVAWRLAAARFILCAL